MIHTGFLNIVLDTLSLTLLLKVRKEHPFADFISAIEPLHIHGKWK